MKHIVQLVGAGSFAALTVLIMATDIDKQTGERSAQRAALRAAMVAVGEIGDMGVGSGAVGALALVIREHERARAQRGDSPTMGE